MPKPARAELTKAWKKTGRGLPLTAADIKNAGARDAQMAERMEAFFSGREPVRFKLPEGWTHERIRSDGLQLERLALPRPHSSRVLLQLHGGGYQLDLQDLFRRMAALQAPCVDAGEAWMVHYRLAPRHVYPAALEDAETAWNALFSRGVEASDIVVCADSAGANLALALCLELKRQGRAQPGLLALLSPWACMELDSPSRRANARRDCVLGEGSPLHALVGKPSPYAGGLELSDPRLSPVYADLSGLPPMLIQAGGHEAILDDALALASRAAMDGVEVSLTVYPGMPHDFALLLPNLPESRAALQELRDFALRRHPAWQS